MARKTGPVRPESEPTLAQPGDVYESSFDGAGLSLYPASAFQEASDTPLDPRVYESVADFATRGTTRHDASNGCFVQFPAGRRRGRRGGRVGRSGRLEA
ncbi:MAG: hypothetical protein U0835_20475 [Isosphaeraceae bacterium]